MDEDKNLTNFQLAETVDYLTYLSYTDANEGNRRAYFHTAQSLKAKIPSDYEWEDVIMIRYHICDFFDLTQGVDLRGNLDKELEVKLVKNVKIIQNSLGRFKYTEGDKGSKFATDLAALNQEKNFLKISQLLRGLLDKLEIPRSPIASGNTQFHLQHQGNGVCQEISEQDIQSIDMTDDDVSEPAKKKRRVVPPLSEDRIISHPENVTKTHKIRSGGIRRKTKRKRWKNREEDEFLRLIRLHGTGAWKDILNADSSLLNMLKDRTGSMLRDKHRNLLKHKHACPGCHFRLNEKDLVVYCTNEECTHTYHEWDCAEKTWNALQKEKKDGDENYQFAEYDRSMFICEFCQKN